MKLRLRQGADAIVSWQSDPSLVECENCGRRSRTETDAARAGMGKGMPALFASVFLAFVVVAVVVLAVRYVF
jgi:hypothetical protein